MSIHTSGLTRFFGSFPAVNQLDLSVPSSTVTGLVGPNGAGKTTLLLMLAALLRPDHGSITVAGLDPVTQPREVHRAVGWMPDAFGTWDSLTCTEILLTFAAAQGLDRPTAQARAIEMLSLVHLSEMARSPARVLSRGQKQRLGLARALIHSPQVLLLDEPAAGMDPRSRADLRTLLRHLASQGTTVLVSSHVLGELEEMVDGVVFMSGGRAVTSPDQAPSGTTQAASEASRARAGGAAGAASPPEADRAGPADSVDNVEAGTDSVDAAGAPAQPGAEPGAPPPVTPVPLRRTWRITALDTVRLHRWAQDAGLEARPTPDGSLRLPVPDDAMAARTLRSALEAGVDVVSFAPASGALEEAYLTLEGGCR